MSASFSYDAFGRRRAKTVSSTTTQFLYDGLNPAQELESGAPIANLLTGLSVDEYFARTDASGTVYYLIDPLHSTVALTDTSGTVRTEYTYEPFGANSTSGASTANAFAFTGRERDGTGLSFYRARYYDPRVQRFISDDPLRFRGGSLNLQAYVANAPIDLADPTGLCLPVCAYPLVTPLAAALEAAALWTAATLAAIVAGDYIWTKIVPTFPQPWDPPDHWVPKGPDVCTIQGREVVALALRTRTRT